MSNMLDWAEREVAIACEKENPNKDNEEGYWVKDIGREEE